MRRLMFDVLLPIASLIVGAVIILWVIGQTEPTY